VVVLLAAGAGAAGGAGVAATAGAGVEGGLTGVDEDVPDVEEAVFGYFLLAQIFEKSGCLVIPFGSYKL
jgi:hypothetical protein